MKYFLKWHISQQSNHQDRKTIPDHPELPFPLSCRVSKNYIENFAANIIDPDRSVNFAENSIVTVCNVLPLWAPSEVGRDHDAELTERSLGAPGGVGYSREARRDRPGHYEFHEHSWPDH